MSPQTKFTVEEAPAIPSLTGIRFFLAAYVVVFHLGKQFIGGNRGPLSNFAGAGYVGVGMFFVLSGFVLGYNYLGNESLDRRRFWVARGARIFPAYVVAQALSFPFIYLGWRHLHEPLRNWIKLAGTEMVVFVTGTQAWYVNPGVFNYPVWSLSCEFFFYALFPYLARPLVLLSRKGLLAAAGCLAVMSAAAPAAYLLAQPDHVAPRLLTQKVLTNYSTYESDTVLRQKLWHGKYVVFIYNPIVHLPLFLLGAATGRYKRAFRSGTGSAIRDKLALGAAAASILLLLLFSGGIPHILLQDCIIGVLFCACIANANALPPPVAGFLSSRPLIILGEASYAMYMLQIPVSAAWNGFSKIVFHATIATRLISFLGYFIVLVVLSVLTFFYIEKPVRLWVRRNLGSRELSLAGYARQAWSSTPEPVSFPGRR